jgi:hypothetical protein
MKESNKIITNKVRAAYVSVFEKRLNELSGKEEYSLCILIPKSDKGVIEKINAAIKKTISDKWGQKIPPGLKLPLRDGDAEGKGDDFVGQYFMNLKSNTKPGIVDMNLNHIMSTDEFSSGDYCRVSISPYAYDNKANKGVAFGLNNIQVLQKGESMSGRLSAEKEFTVVEEQLPF